MQLLAVGAVVLVEPCQRAPDDHGRETAVEMGGGRFANFGAGASRDPLRPFRMEAKGLGLLLGKFSSR